MIFDFSEPSKGTTTKRPRPEWIPPVVSAPDSWPKIKGGRNETDPDSSEKIETAKNSDLIKSGESLRDPKDPHQSITRKVIEVKVPKPLDFPNFGGISPSRRPSPFLPIVLSATTTTSRSPLSTEKSKQSPTLSPTKKPFTAERENMQVMVNFTQFCPPTTARGLYWNWTRAVRNLKHVL